MQITLNGERKEVHSTTISELKTELSIPKRGIAIEINRVIIPHSNHDFTILNENDVVEIVSFIGGG